MHACSDANKDDSWYVITHPVNCKCHNGGTPQQSDTILKCFLTSFYNSQTLNGPQISMGK